METLMAEPSNLDDPEYARFAWKRYWMLMRWMTGVTVICVILALGGLYMVHGMISIHFYIATGGGIGLMLLLTAALMGLVFMSSGTGHDEAVEEMPEGHVTPDE